MAAVAALVLASAGRAVHPSPPMWPARPHWQSYLPAAAPGRIEPVRVVTVSGVVADAAALAGGHGVAVLTLTPGGAPPRVVLDFGRDVGGRPRLDVAGASGTPRLRIAYSETLAGLSINGDGPQTTSDFDSGDPHRFDDYEVASRGALTGAYLQGGERYELVTLLAPGRVSLRSVGLRDGSTPVTAGSVRGWFLSSSDRLNRIWYAGVVTAGLVDEPAGTRGNQASAVNDRPLLLDGAKRDRAVWAGDLDLTDRTVLDALDPTAVKRSLALLFAHPSSAAVLLAPGAPGGRGTGPLPGVCSPFTNAAQCYFYSATYSMLDVVDLAGYLLATGDVGFVRHLWPAVTRQMAWDASQVDARGLFATSSADGWDWNVEVHPGELTYVNAVYVLTLRDAAALADALRDRSDAAAYRQQAAAVAAAVNRRLLDPVTGLYDPAVGQTGVVQDANVLAILSGIASPDAARTILAALDAALASPYGPVDVGSPGPPGYVPVISPYIGGYQLDAEFQAGRTAAGIDLHEREWGRMVDGDPGGTDWERMSVAGTPPAPATSMAHGWSTAATSALTRYVLGVSPTAPGYATFEVAPQPGSLGWAEGSVPTPRGSVVVRWGQRGASAFRLQVSVPERSAASIAVPGSGSGSTITLDGRPVWDRRGFHPRTGATGAQATPTAVVLTGVAPGSHVVDSHVG